MAKELAISGLLVTLAGVLILFRYGMPYRVETKGEISIICEQTDEDEVKLDGRYRALGYFGLALAIVGTALQVAGAVYA